MGTHLSSTFATLRRQEFRRFFQPTRIVLGVLPSGPRGEVNIIALCFEMYCSYKPPMMAFSIQKRALSYSLIRQSNECVLAVPGESLAKETLLCGVKSGRDVYKAGECKFPLVQSERVSVPGIGNAIANIEVRLEKTIETGDHLTAIGRVLRFAVNRENAEKCLLSVGPNTTGYRVLARHGIHRIAVVES